MVVALYSACARTACLTHSPPSFPSQCAVSSKCGVPLQAFLQGMNPQEVQFLAIRIRRGHVLEDALNTIAARADELKKPLRIVFSSGAHRWHRQDLLPGWNAAQRLLEAFSVREDA